MQGLTCAICHDRAAKARANPNQYCHNYIETNLVLTPFRSKYDLLVHTSQEHNQIYKCERTCYEKFTKRADYREHMKLHYDHPYDAYADCTTVGQCEVRHEELKKLFTCPGSIKQVSTLAEVKEWQYDEKGVPELFVCPRYDCDLQFNTKAEVKQHISIAHTEFRPLTDDEISQIPLDYTPSGNLAYIKDS